MEPRTFQPKAFYRNLDTLLSMIGGDQPLRFHVSLVLNELVESFGADLGISGGCLYRLAGQRFRQQGKPVGQDDRWPESFGTDDEAVALLLKHKAYIYVDSVTPPWGADSVAVVVGERDQYLLAYRLGEGWLRETLDFVLNTIRSTLNLSRSARYLDTTMQEAAEIQKSLLPASDPEFPGFDISGHMVPAERVGGDLYDFSVLAEGVLTVAIGDASGHGLPAALLARDVVTGLRMGMEKELKISGVVRKLNRVINRSRLSTRFISLFYGELEPRGTLVYVNAGHPGPMHFHGNEMTTLGIGGTILGPLEDTVFDRGFAFLEPGDILLLYTDGLTETRGVDGDMYGTGRLASCVQSNRDRPASDIIDAIYRSVRDYSSSDSFQDDATAVVIRRV
jgi:sigma-B regulation protein RsbU (phosphoserine phosphatase)